MYSPFHPPTLQHCTMQMITIMTIMMDAECRWAAVKKGGMDDEQPMICSQCAMVIIKLTPEKKEIEILELLIFGQIGMKKLTDRRDRSNLVQRINKCFLPTAYLWAIA